MSDISSASDEESHLYDMDKHFLDDEYDLNKEQLLYQKDADNLNKKLDDLNNKVISDDDVNDEDEDADDEVKQLENENFDPSLIDFGDPSLESSKEFKAQETVATLNVQFSKNDRLRMIYMRSFFNKIEKDFQEKDLVTQKISQEIKASQSKIESLELKRDEIFKQIQDEQNSENITVVKRLDKEHASLCQEIELESKVLEKLNEAFSQADYDRSKALLEKTKYAPANAQLKKNEAILIKQKEEKALIKKNIEDKKVATIKKKLERSKQIEEEKIRIENMKQKDAIEQAKVARMITAQYLKENLREMKEAKLNQEKEMIQAAELKRKELINLKNTIDHNKEMFEAKVKKNRFNEIKRKEALKKEMQEISDRGENPNFFIPRKIKMEEYEKVKKKFEEEKLVNTQEIVKKILKENENLEKKKKLYPNLFNINLKPLDPIQKSKEKNQNDLNSLKQLNKLAQSFGVSDDQILNELKLEEENGHENEEILDHRSQFGSTTIASKDGDDDSDEDELNNTEEILVKPEFEGLWNKKAEKYDANDLYKTKTNFPSCFKTKAEIELYLNSLEKLKKSAVREQVVAGRKFAGTSFKSQPKIIHFKDFDVGNKYTIKVTLTNISYTINTCKFVDLTEKLKDFITIDFQPPGQLSAGLTFDFSVTFEPKINKDLEGEISFLATNGPFSIPLSCTIKKCDLSLNTSSVSFGTIVIGETINKKVQLINKGALGTGFKLFTLREYKKYTDEMKKKSQKEQNETVNDESKGVEINNEERFEDEIKIGKINGSYEGYIEPFSTVELDFFFAPSFPGKFNQDFIVKFDDANSKEISISSKATAIDVPIWIENINIDLRICMYDRLYQEVIKVHNRASAALRITFEVPPEMKNHLEILPKTAFIQAKSEFSAQIKFVAKTTLAKDAPNYFDNTTGVLELPLFIKVADQTNTVDYNLHAIVTTSDLEFDVTEIDFGYCTIYETVRATVNLTNKSILCQPFGFVKLNDYVNVQPNDGFGTLLPNETIPIDINFSPKLAKEFKFTVVCKSLVNRDFVINCRGIGVHPPLRLSAQRINFKATSIKSTSSTTIYVCNDHLDYDQHRHPVPRIGNGEIARVGPTYFEFDLPENCPFKLSPTVGCVSPGQKAKITVQYTADIEENIIKKETAKLIKNKVIEKGSKMVTAENTENVELVQIETKTKKKNPTKLTINKSESASVLSNPIETNPKTPDLDSIETNSQDYLSCLANTLSNYKGGLKSFQIPCYVMSYSEENADPTKPISYSIHNTLYLDVVCPSVKPEMIVISSESNNNINFGKVSTGQKVIKKIILKNISESMIELKSSLLDPNGPFLILNKFYPIEPGQTHSLIIAFSPTKNCTYQENLIVRTSKSNITFVLNAVGVEPSFSLSYEENILDFGYCPTHDKIEKNIEMKNNSKVPIEFNVTLDNTNREYQKENELNRVMNSNNLKFKPTIGPNNYQGYSCFDVYPVQGTIPAGGKMDLKIVFSPDHSSELYADVMRISLLSSNSKTIQLYGKSRNKNIYIRGVEHLLSNMNYESMMLTDFEADQPQNDIVESKESQPKAELSLPTPILVTLYSNASSKTIGEFSQAEKIIYIGYMKTSSTGDKKEVKKNGEFSFDNVKEINSKGFNIDLVKSAVEPGGERQVKITWKPQPGSDTKQTVQTSILLTTKSNAIETWRVILQGRIIESNISQNI